MANTLTVNGVAMRENSIGTAILLSIVTLGIYWFILAYRNTMDIHRAAGEDTTLPLVLYIVSIFFPLGWFAVFSLNGIRLNDVRESRQQAKETMWVIALVLHFLLAFVGSIVWAVHYDRVIREMAQSA